MSVLDAEGAGRPGWVDPFRPLPGNGDAHTIAARYWPTGWSEGRWPTESRLFRVEPSVEVLGKMNRAGGEGPVIVVVHGLVACSQARYMFSFARRALESGFDVLRLNVRSCGGTEHLSSTLYHSGLTSDLGSVVEQLAPHPVFVAGFSMGGNMALKLAGEWGAEAPRHVGGVCGISVPIRLGACADRIGDRRNWVYEYRFLRSLRQALGRMSRLRPEFLDREQIACRARSIREFDHRVTAPSFGYRDADDYYEQASAARVLDRIRVPALLIQAQDDPFVPSETYSEPALEAAGGPHLLTTPSGGHVAFLQRGARRFWAEEQALNFFRSLTEGR